LVRVGDDRFVDAVVLLKQGIKYIEDKRIKIGVQQVLASSAVKGRIKSTTPIDMGLGSEIIGKSLGRLPYITRKGHLVLGSEHFKRGDVVALIRGSQVPFVLRRQDQISGRYQVVGEAYVDGIMDGEAARDPKWS
ncbi:putative heterokaryon incompatibility protein 6, OR allele, partial [Cucurbitaria berberidis CBS 394.84]